MINSMNSNSTANTDESNIDLNKAPVLNLSILADTVNRADYIREIQFKLVSSIQKFVDRAQMLGYSVVKFEFENDSSFDDKEAEAVMVYSTDSDGYLTVTVASNRFVRVINADEISINNERTNIVLDSIIIDILSNQLLKNMFAFTKKTIDKMHFEYTPCIISPTGIKIETTNYENEKEKLRIQTSIENYKYYVDRVFSMSKYLNTLQIINNRISLDAKASAYESFTECEYLGGYDLFSEQLYPYRDSTTCMTMIRHNDDVIIQVNSDFKSLEGIFNFSLSNLYYHLRNIYVDTPGKLEIQLNFPVDTVNVVEIKFTGCYFKCSSLYIRTGDAKIPINFAVSQTLFENCSSITLHTVKRIGFSKLSAVKKSVYLNGEPVEISKITKRLSPYYNISSKKDK